MLQTRHPLLVSVLLCSLVLPMTCVAALGQTPQTSLAPDMRIGLKTALVLTPEFCATKTKKGTWGINEEKFPIGKAACQQLEPALLNVFPNLTRVEAASSARDAELVLVPRFVDIGETQNTTAFTRRELVILVEWTAKNKSGNTVWIETVQGSAKHIEGNMLTHWIDLKVIVRNSVMDLAQQSASEMAASPVLRKLAQQTAPAAAPGRPPAKAPAAQVP
jgi:hypothetical protein